MPKRKIYTDIYKADAVYAGEATTISEAAKERGINSTMLGRWTKEAKSKLIKEPVKLPDQLPAPGEQWHPETASQSEEHLLSEITRLEDENQTLRKALALYVNG